jgi:hypothetical protein
VLVVALALAGCGGTRRPTPTATPTSTSTATPTPAGEDQPGGAGDEAEARVPVSLVVAADGTISPATVSVPAFLALDLRVRNRTARTIAVTMEGADPPDPLSVPAGRTGRRRLDGVRPGRYAIAAGAARATLVAGAEPGP